MLRQLHVFHKGEQIYNYIYAMALGDEELENVKRTIKSYIDMPLPGKIFQKPLGEFQLFHRTLGSNLFLMITDLVDNREHVEEILRLISKNFKEYFPDFNALKKTDLNLKEFEKFLQDMQYELHSKIVVVGPVDSGKTTLFNMLRSNDEKNIMNFAKSSVFQIDNLKFDIWDFQLKDNFSLLWSKFISGADLILLLFDLSNYHLRVISHFMDLHRNEGKLSKILIIGNKRDLVNKEDIKLIQNELGIPKFEEISLTEPDIKGKIIQLISEIMKLRKSLPSNFEELKKKAEDAKAEGNLVLAMSKYKELITICNMFQDFKYVASFKQSLKELQEKLEEEKKVRHEIESKKKFEIPGQIKFTKPVTVKPLPLDKSKIRSEITPKISKPEIVPKIHSEIAPKISKPEIAPKMRPEITPKISKPEIEKDELKIKESEIGKLTLFKPSEETEEELTPSREFSKILKELIEKKGSSLSLKLCEHLINQLQTTLGRTLTLEDVETAAKIFIKQDNL
ncbi:MAG: ADP-ribosylation factor-like protein [Promethearchaeota archaeon]